MCGNEGRHRTDTHRCSESDCFFFPSASQFRLCGSAGVETVIVTREGLTMQPTPAGECVLMLVGLMKLGEQGTSRTFERWTMCS